MKSIRGGRYVLLRKLGEGSQGETFEATASSTRPIGGDLAGDFQRYVTQARSGAVPKPTTDHVAVKCFRVSEAKAWKDVELAEREARTLASLDHPLLPKYIEHFEEDGALYLVMEKVEGESLAKIGPIGAAEVMRMLEDVGSALRYLHARAPAIIHRDIKPSNVIRRPEGAFSLVDFGAVRDRLKPRGGSTVVGTFGFMAPEQFQGRASTRSDLYGLGATAIALLTGEQPEDLPHRGLGIDVARALPKDTPRGLVDALTAMLAPDPEQRVASIDEALALLHRPDKSPSRRERRARRDTDRDEQRRRDKELRRQRRALARTRRVPFVPRVVAKLGLLVAFIVVWMVLGAFVPLFLGLLSLIFGQIFGNALGRWAGASINAAKRAQAGLGRASSWLSGHRAEGEPAAETLPLRIAEEHVHVRVATGDDDREEEEEEDDHAEPEGSRRRRS